MKILIKTQYVTRITTNLEIIANTIQNTKIKNKKEGIEKLQKRHKTHNDVKKNQ